jgi:hypothetical protein
MIKKNLSEPVPTPTIEHLLDLWRRMQEDYSKYHAAFDLHEAEVRTAAYALNFDRLTVLVASVPAAPEINDEAYLRTAAPLLDAFNAEYAALEDRIADLGDMIRHAQDARTESARKREQAADLLYRIRAASTTEST